MKDHVQDMLQDQLVEITLHSGQLIRDFVQSADLIGIVLPAGVENRSGGYMSSRVVPWSSIQDLVVIDGEINDHRTFSESLTLWYGEGPVSEWNGSKHIGSNGESGHKDCSVCMRLYGKN